MKSLKPVARHVIGWRHPNTLALKWKYVDPPSAFEICSSMLGKAKHNYGKRIDLKVYWYLLTNGDYGRSGVEQQVISDMKREAEGFLHPDAPYSFKSRRVLGHREWDRFTEKAWMKHAMSKCRRYPAPTCCFKQALVHSWQTRLHIHQVLSSESEKKGEANTVSKTM